jgi:hypothetical protein
MLMIMIMITMTMTQKDRADSSLCLSPLSAAVGAFQKVSKSACGQLSKCFPSTVVLDASVDSGISVDSTAAADDEDEDSFPLVFAPVAGQMTLEYPDGWDVGVKSTLEISLT